MNNKSVYVVIANEEEKVRECIVLSDSEKAQEVWKYLERIWDGKNVAFVSRAIDDIPIIVREGLEYE